MTLPIVTLGLKRPLEIEVTVITQTFWSGLAEGRFLLARCSHCSRLSFPPRRICPDCHQLDFTWIEASGRATFYSLTRIHNSPPRYNLLSPVSVAIIDLEEGIRLLTRLLPTNQAPVVGGPCQLVITQHPDGMHYAARPAESS